MISKQHYNKINEPIRISLVFIEINFAELAMVSLSLFIIMAIFGFINVYFNIFGVLFFLCLLALYGPIIGALNYANKQDHPQFLISWISFKFFQPKRITFYSPKPTGYVR
jgi:membrane-bound ClpP family serine protease